MNTLPVSKKCGSARGIMMQAYRGLRRRLSPLRKLVTDVLRADHCPLYVNWSPWSRQTDNMTKVHYSAARIIWRERKLYALLSSLIWPLKVPVLAWKMTMQHGRQVRQETGFGLARQYLDQLYFAIRYFISPRIYYRYDFYDPGRRRNASQYVLGHETVPMLLFVTGAADYKVFDDKRVFFEECRRFGLPTIPVIAEFEDGELKKWGADVDQRLPETDLFAKPALGRCGQGVARYLFERPGLYRRDDGSTVSGKGLLDEIAEKSVRQPYILQERFLNHPEIAKLTQVLCTSRVVTCRRPDGKCEYISAILRMGTGNACNDNYSTGGIAFPVDEKSGALGKGIRADLHSSRIEVHPENGHKLAGFQLPCWQEVIRLCLKAHADFSEYAYVGWDVAITKDGPVLVEGNLRWAEDAMQRPHCEPLGELFAETFMLHMERMKLLNLF